MKECKVERRLKTRLEGYGFAVRKLVTPASAGAMDRLILMPKWSPAPPEVVELKAPDKKPRPLQEAVANDWKDRGVTVRDYCDTLEKVDELCDILLYQAVQRYSQINSIAGLPEHIYDDYRLAYQRIHR